MRREEFRYLLEPKLKEVKMVLSWNASSSNRLVFVLSLTPSNHVSAQSNSRFLKSVGKLYDAFSVHKKVQCPPTRTLPDATEKVKQCKQILAEYENSVRSIGGCSKPWSKMTLNEPKAQ